MSFIRKYDPITTLFLVCKKYTYGNAREKAVVMDEHPVVPFLYNLYVSCGEYGQQMPSENDIEQLIKDTEDYCKNFFVFKEFSQANEAVKLIQSQYIINLVNQELYPFQLEHRLSIFDNMENDILNILGFRPNSTYQFVIAIGHIYRNKFNSKSTDYLFTEEDIKRCFTLTNDIEASFKKELFSYLKAISTEVGSEKHRYNDLLDEDISWRKPLIKTPKGYLGINLIPNTFGIFSQIEYLLKQKCRNDQRAKIVLEKYYKNRAKYLEDRSFEILKNIFHKDVFKNLKYKYKGKTYETDILVKYDNKIIVVETKI